jgi:hypothetical protein
VETWDCVVFLSKLLFETGCADISARAEWGSEDALGRHAFS